MTTSRESTGIYRAAAAELADAALAQAKSLVLSTRLPRGTHPESADRLVRRSPQTMSDADDTGLPSG